MSEIAYYVGLSLLGMTIVLTIRFIWKEFRAIFDLEG